MLILCGFIYIVANRLYVIVPMHISGADPGGSLVCEDIPSKTTLHTKKTLFVKNVRLASIQCHGHRLFLGVDILKIIIGDAL